jgi:hypothetical protein
VLGHFGPVKTDLERTGVALKARLRRAEVQVEILQKELSSSSREVAEAAQPVVGAALNRTYHISVLRLARMVEYVDEIKDQVLGPLDALAAKIQVDLDVIVRQVKSNVSILAEAKAILDGSKADMEAAHSKGLATDVLKKQLMDCEAAMEHCENVQSKPIEAAMSKLESLELYRIEEQTRIIRHAVLAENMLLQDLKTACADLEACAKALNVDAEVQQLAEEVDAELS